MGLRPRQSPATTSHEPRATSRKPESTSHEPRAKSHSETPAPPPGRLVTGYFKQRPPYRTLRSRGTRDWLLTFTLKGQGDYRQEEVRFAARPGDLVLLEPGALHHYGCLESRYWEFLWAHFIARPAWMAWLKFPSEGKGLRRLPIGNAGARRRIRAAFERCHRDARAGGGFAEDLALNALEETLLLAAREQALTTGEARLSPGVRRAVEHLAEHLAGAHRIADLARLAGLSPGRFAHRFKEETGDSAIAYLNKLRVQRAARLLAFSGRSVKEIAAEVGFESPFYFSRVFKKQYGISPAGYAAAALT